MGLYGYTRLRPMGSTDSMGLCSCSQAQPQPAPRAPARNPSPLRYVEPPRPGDPITIPSDRPFRIDPRAPDYWSPFDPGIPWNPVPYEPIPLRDGPREMWPKDRPSIDPTRVPNPCPSVIPPLDRPVEPLPAPVRRDDPPVSPPAESFNPDPLSPPGAPFTEPEEESYRQCKRDLCEPLWIRDTTRCILDYRKQHARCLKKTNAEDRRWCLDAAESTFDGCRCAAMDAYLDCLWLCRVNAIRVPDKPAFPSDPPSPERHPDNIARVR